MRVPHRATAFCWSTAVDVSPVRDVRAPASATVVTFSCRSCACRWAGAALGRTWAAGAVGAIGNGPRSSRSTSSAGRVRGRQRSCGQAEELDGVGPLDPCGELLGRHVEHAARRGHGSRATEEKKVARLEQSSAAIGRDVTRCPWKHACFTLQYIIYSIYI